MEIFKAKNVILACGGAGQVYKPTTNGLIVTGDGIAMAYRIGAPLMDMEMVQYHPTCLVETGILITEGARGEGAHLLNSEGERFMEKSAPNKMELASRDVVSRAEQIEINEGRGVGPGGRGIYLDVTVVPAGIDPEVDVQARVLAGEVAEPMQTGPHDGQHVVAVEQHARQAHDARTEAVGPRALVEADEVVGAERPQQAVRGRRRQLDGLADLGEREDGVVSLEGLEDGDGAVHGLRAA